MARYFFFVLSFFISLTVCSQTYYIVRHAEKVVADGSTGMNATDPPLTEAGKARAEALKEVLKNEQIAHIFSTNTIRTRSTAEPLGRYLNIPVQAYNARPDTAFIRQLKALRGNVLIVGHSNTVDDVVNLLCGEQNVPQDLDEKEYDNLFIVTHAAGKMIFERRKYGAGH